MTFTQLLERRRERKKLVDQAQAIRDLAAKENRKPFPDEDKRFDELLNDADAMLKDIEREERLLAVREQAKVEPGAPRMLGGSAEAVSPKPRFIDEATGQEVRCFTAKESWLEGREYELPDGIRPEELSLARLVRGLVTGDWKKAGAERRTMAESIGSLGGVLVPEPIADRIIQSARTQLRVITAGALTLRMTEATLTLAKVTAEPSASWVPENAELAFSDMTFEPVKLQAKKLISATKASRELIEDAGNLEGILTDALGFAVAKELDRAALLGTGVGEPLGLLNTAGVGGVDLAGTALDIDHLINAIFALVGANFDAASISAIFNSDAGKALAKLKASTAGTYQESTTPELYRDLRKLVTTQIPTAAGKTNLYVGDYRNIVVGMRTGLSLEVSNQAYDATAGESAWTRNQVWFRTGMRCDALTVRPAAFHIVKNAGV